MNAEERKALIDARAKKIEDRLERIWARDAWRDFEVWEVPVEALLLNIDNRRFAAERRLFEDLLKRPIDPENSPEDEESVMSILLDTSHRVDDDKITGRPSKDTLMLERDWTARKQESPIWIRPDGTVHNGNRRLALVKRLQLEAGKEGATFLDALILDPAEIDEQTLFEMEQREQLTENLKVRYTDINLLLALRDAANAEGIDWNDSDSMRAVAGRLQHAAGGDANYALIQLNAIKYMDAFLEDSDSPREYQKVLRMVESFRDIGKTMSMMESEYEDDAPDMLRLLFSAARARSRYGEIRDLKKLFRVDRRRFEELVRRIDEAEADWIDSGAKIADPDVSATDPETDDDDADEEDDEAPGPNVPGYPKDQVRTAIKDSIDSLNASDLAPASALEQALNRLAALTDERALLADALDSDKRDEVVALVRRVLEWADEARTLIGK